MVAQFLFFIFLSLITIDSFAQAPPSLPSSYHINIRKSKERGISDTGWLKSYHTFSFASYNDPKHIRFRSLKTLNEEWLKGGSGFSKHPHKNMEIITYVVEGSLEHTDSLGKKSIIRPNEIHRISAGTGIVHSIYNHEKNKETHAYQIWIQPKKLGLKPNYQQKIFNTSDSQSKFVLVLSNTAREGSIRIEQDVDVYLSRPIKGDVLQFVHPETRHLWIQMVKGHMRVNDKEIKTGDAVSISNIPLVKFTILKNSEFLLFDLA